MSEPSPTTSASPPVKRAEKIQGTAGIIRWTARHYIWPEYKLVIIGIMTNIGLAATAGALPWLIQQTVDGVFSGDASFFSQFEFYTSLKTMLNLEGANGDRLALLYVITIFSIIIITFRSVFSYTANIAFDF